VEEQNHQQLEGILEPKLMYHYTDQNGLLGILKTKSIWATHVRYLNDLQVITAGEDEFRQVMRELAGSHPGEGDDGSRVEAVLDAIRSCDMYVASFSAANDGDSLSLWRAYGSRGIGFSLGFRLKELRGIVEILTDPKKSPDGRWLSKVDYSAAGKSGFREAFELTINSIKTHSCDRDVLNVAAFLLARFFPTIKNGGFADEVEYRIVHVKSPKAGLRYVDGVEFRPGTFSLIPYVQVPLSPTSADPLLLSRIVVGPCAHPNEAVRAVQMLLATKGIQAKSEDFPEGVEVANSRVPYRNW
jgi:hypothetical protein